MNIQGFIFNWKPHEPDAIELERRLGHLVPVTVVNSEEGLTGVHDGWVHLDDSAYFSAQWNTALGLFEADLLFHIQADARCDDFEHLLERAACFVARGDVGVYEPDVDYSPYRYDIARLRALGDGGFEVPITDQTCWLVAGDVLAELPAVDLSVNRYGWGISAAVAAICRLQGRLCVRDYDVPVAHPATRGYPSEPAVHERDAYLASLGPTIAGEAARLYEWRRRVTPAPRKPRGVGRRVRGWRGRTS